MAALAVRFPLGDRSPGRHQYDFNWCDPADDWAGGATKTGSRIAVGDEKGRIDRRIRWVTRSNSYLTSTKREALLRIRSGERTTTFPRRFEIAPRRCHPLNIRQAVKRVTFEALANSSLVISISVPNSVLCPIPSVRQRSTCASLSCALLVTRARCDARNQAMYSDASVSTLALSLG